MIKNYLPISIHQERFFLEWAFASNENTYNVSFVNRMKGILNQELFKQAITIAIEEVEVIHAQFSSDGTSCYHGSFSINDFYHQSFIDANITIEHQIKKLLFEPFDLLDGPLVRIRLLESRDQEEYYFVFVMHHIIGDAIWQSNFSRQIQEIYNTLIGGEISSSKKFPSFYEGVNASKLIFNKEYQTNAQHFWLNLINDSPLRINLPYHPDVDLIQLDTSLSDKSGDYLFFDLTPEQSILLRTYVKNKNTTLFTVLSAVFSLALWKFSNQKKFVLSYTVNTRPSGYEKAPGCFTNNVPMVFDMGKVDTFDELLTYIKEQRRQARKFQDYPLLELIQALRQHLGITSGSSFNVGISKSHLNTMPFELEGIEVTPLHFSWSENSIYDLGLIYDDYALNYIKFRVDYRKSLFSINTVQRIIEAYKTILNTLFNGSEYTIKDYPLLSPATYNNVVNTWNDTPQRLFEKKTIHEYFQYQAEKQPDKIALVYQGKKMNYASLNKKSNQLARCIQHQYQIRQKTALQHDTPIALCLNRGFEMVVGMLAVLKAGGAYVPIDKSYPQQRIDYILQDTQTVLVLTQSEILQPGGVQLPTDKVLCIDLSLRFYEDYAQHNLSINSTYEDLAYIIYTSGTSGWPKGVMIEHRSYLQLNAANHFDGLYAKRTLWTNYTFDVSVFEIFSALLQGSELYILSDEIKNDSKKLFQFLGENAINYAYIPPFFIKDLANFLDDHALNDFTCLLTGVDKVFSADANRIAAQQIKFINAYGPTEATICTTAYVIDGALSPYKHHLPIGKPLSGEKVYVLDDNLLPVSVGVVGELYIGGAGLARAYLNQEELTNQVFIHNPFMTEEDAAHRYTRLYKTGDMVRWLEDGNLQFIGRQDNQVKIQGYRIEITEVENVLIKIEGIKQCCIRVKHNNETKYLIAYYVLEEHFKALSANKIQELLAQQMPIYMVPSVLIKIEAFPLTINGKIDYRALPEPFIKGAEEDYIAPISDIEQKVADIWKKVLEVHQVGLNDDFFRLGGNSLFAIQISHQMAKLLDVEVEVASLFRYKTIAKWLANGFKQKQIQIPRAQDGDFRLSFAQERLWFFDQYEEDSSAYHIPLILELQFGVEEQRVNDALQKIISRHEVLRSTIQIGPHQQEVQVIHEAPLEISTVILQNKEALASFLEEDFRRPFDLNSEYPIRATIIIVTTENDLPEQKILFINLHHIASDGWSLEILLRELNTYYEIAPIEGEAPVQPTLSIQYKDYAAWQRVYLQGPVLNQQLAYWKNKLQGYEPLVLPTDHSRPNAINYSGDFSSFTINQQTSKALRILAQDCRTSLHTVLLSAIYFLLGKYSGQEDIIIGMATANRPYAQIEGLIGCFINMQVNRVQLNSTQGFIDLVQNVHQNQVEAQRYQDLPFDRLVDELEIDRDPSRHPIFQVAYIAQRFDIDDNQSNKYFKLFPNNLAHKTTKFDLSFFIDESQETIQGLIKYSTSLFHDKTIEKLCHHFIFLVERLANNPDMTYGKVSLLLPSELEEIVYRWNATNQAFPREKTINDLFEEQVQKRPDHIAFVCDGESISYRELNQKSNQLARHLKAQYKLRTNEDIKPDSLITLFLDRSLEMIVSILAVLKVGGAYVPISPAFPKERIDYILKDTQSVLLLCQRKTSDAHAVQQQHDKMVLVDLTEGFYKEMNSANLPINHTSTDLAYVLYTSGTTGRPKGVMTEHSGIINLINGLKAIYKFEDSEKLLLFHNYVFDVSVEQITISLLSGVTSYIIHDQSLLESNRFIDFVVSNKLTHVHATPSFWASIDPAKLKGVKRVLFGGEYLSKELFDNYKKNVGLVINKYGPTESSVTSIVSINSYLLRKAILPNTKIYILDAYQNPVPIGVIGEIYIGGAGLARGYLNNEKLTKQRFVANPFATETDITDGFTRLYKTGDLAFWKEDGKIVYMGRNDDQVKIRGYRIELGEIEQVLTGIEGVKKSCVLVKQRGQSSENKYLAGYYILEKGQSIPQAEIMDQLSSVLPDYMLPNIIIEMDTFPLTINGKLDKRALPEPVLDAQGKDYTPPVTHPQKVICKIWEEILGLPQVGITDDFFKIGGNSLLAIRASHQISKTLNCKLRVGDIFKYKNIEGIVQHINFPEMNAENVEKEF